MSIIGSRLLKKINVVLLSGAMMVAINSCRSQGNQQSSTEILGTYDAKNLKQSDLTPLERDELYSAQKKVYDTVQNILAKRYLDSWFADYQAKNKLASLEEAKKDYYAKNATVSKEEVQKFIQDNANNPQMQQIPLMEREDLVRQYLSRNLQDKADRDLLQKAEQENKIKVLGFSIPEAPTFKFSNSGYKFDPALTDAKVTIVEFGDYQCPYCVRASTVVDQLLSTYKGKIQYVYKEFPLMSIHPMALPAAIAAKCAGQQGKYWDMHTAIFNRSPMDPITADDFTNHAKKLTLNMEAFTKCQNDEAVKKQVLAEMDEGTEAGVNGTPSFFINGQKFEDAPTLENFKRKIDRLLSAK